jgi:hypothetical protein
MIPDIIPLRSASGRDLLNPLDALLMALSSEEGNAATWARRLLRHGEAVRGAHTTGLETKPNLEACSCQEAPSPKPPSRRRRKKD